jgi:hypothetical protein
MVCFAEMQERCGRGIEKAVRCGTRTLDSFTVASRSHLWYSFIVHASNACFLVFRALDAAKHKRALFLSTCSRTVPVPDEGTQSILYTQESFCIQPTV